MAWLVEQPLPIFLVGVAVQAVLLVILVQTGRAVTLLAMLSAALLTAALLALEWFVVTDAERVEALLYEAAAAVDENDIAGLLDCIAPDADPMRRDVRTRLAQFNIIEARITSNPDVTVDRTQRPPTASARFFGRVRVRDADTGEGPYVNRFTVQLAEGDSGWKIIGYRLGR